MRSNNERGYVSYLGNSSRIEAVTGRVTVVGFYPKNSKLKALAREAPKRKYAGGKLSLQTDEGREERCKLLPKEHDKGGAGKRWAVTIIREKKQRTLVSFREGTLSATRGRGAGALSGESLPTVRAQQDRSYSPGMYCTATVREVDWGGERSPGRGRNRHLGEE